LAKNHLHFAAPQAMAMEVGNLLLEKDLRRETMIDQVLTPQQLPLLKSVYPTANIKTYLPDITTYSYGVLADVRNGGLRKDLTAAFEDTGATPNKNYAKLNPYSSGQKYTERVYDITRDTIPKIATPPTTTYGGNGPVNVDLKGLLWGDLYRFYNYYKSLQPTIGLLNLPSTNPSANHPTGVGDPEAPRPYGVSQATFNNYELNNSALYSNYVTGELSPVCIGLRYDVVLKSEPVTPSTYKLLLEYRPASIWYNPYAVTINCSTPYDQTILFEPEKDTYLEVKDGAVPPVSRYCMLNQGNSANARLALSNNSSETTDFKPGAIRVFAMTAPNNISFVPNKTYGQSGSSMFKACNFGSSWGQNLGSLSSKSASINYYNSMDLVSVANPGDLKSPTVPYEKKFDNLPETATITFGLNNVDYSYFRLQKPADIRRMVVTTWPNQSNASANFAASIGITAGANDVGRKTTVQAKQSKTIPVSGLTGGFLLFSFNMRMKGLRNNPDVRYSNSGFSIPSFMGNSEVFNPISTTFSGCWNEVLNTNHSTFPWPLSLPLSSTFNLNSSTDVDGCSFSTWGEYSAGADPAPIQGGSYRKVLADIPLQPMLSLGQFMHLQVNYTANYDDYLRMTFGSMFVGGSYPNPGVPLDKTLLDVSLPTQVDRDKLMLQYKLYSLDNSYLANQALFDRYFFSTVPPKSPSTSCAQWVEIDNKNKGTRLEDTSTPFLNSRMVPYRKNGVAPLMDDLRDMDKAAANLLLLGAFNINSTSEKAWYALLSSLSGNDLSLWNASLLTTELFSLKDQNLNPIPRFWSATGNATLNEPWCGVRALTKAETRELAKRIVIEVKTRGPFLSMADFLNRRLGNTPSALTRAGALQAAIDNTSPDINANFKGYPNVNADDIPVPTPASDAGNYPSVRPLSDNMKDARGNPWKTSVGMPGYLMQQDLVQAFSPVMAARSDTFVVRTYGEKTDPLTAKSVATAYCEAVVQRLPDYVDPSDSAEATPTNQTNKDFGRRFKIVSFRWLTSNDL
jgi:hypothetical protein